VKLGEAFICKIQFIQFIQSTFSGSVIVKLYTFVQQLGYPVFLCELVQKVM